MRNKMICEVLRIEHLTDETFILTIKNPGISFQPGQYMILSLPEDKESREYSIYNKPNQTELQFLIREVKDGYLSKALKKLKVGSSVEVEGPFGFFTIPETDSENQKYVFIATGTGISPFHSMIVSRPGLNHTLIHGVRYQDERYDYADYKNYQACISTIPSSGFKGRVTDFIKTVQLPTDANYYLSGNSAMINEVTDYLLNKEVLFNKINTEIYF